MIELFLRNTREPVNVGGDFASQLAALDIGVAGLTGSRGATARRDLREACRGIRRQSEAAMRAAIRAVPDGVYAFEDFVDDDGIDRETSSGSQYG